jgi:hypothetical protein
VGVAGEQAAVAVVVADQVEVEVVEVEVEVEVEVDQLPCRGGGRPGLLRPWCSDNTSIAV